MQRMHGIICATAPHLRDIFWLYNYLGMVWGLVTDKLIHVFILLLEALTFTITLFVNKWVMPLIVYITY